MGHMNNRDCYAAAFTADGRVAQYDNHAFY